MAGLDRGRLGCFGLRRRILLVHVAEGGTTPSACKQAPVEASSASPHLFSPEPAWLRACRKWFLMLLPALKLPPLWYSDGN